MDVVFGHQSVGSCQVEKIIIASFCAFQFVFKVLGLSLRKEERHGSRKLNGSREYSSACLWKSEATCGDTPTRTHLLLHLLHLLHRAASLGTFIVAVTKQAGADVAGFAKVLLLLFLRLLEFALRGEALAVVHVVRLHHL